MAKKFTPFILIAVLAVFFVFKIVSSSNHDIALLLSGVAWSSAGDASVGWIKFSSVDEGGSASSIDYGVKVSRGGTISGAAWAGSYGWLSFNADDLVGCPTGTCEARLDFTTNQMSGWARFLGPKNDPGKSAWDDGWVHLAGNSLAGDPYGVTYDPATKLFSGAAWGSDVFGWIVFGGSGCSFCSVRGTNTNKVPVVINVNISNGPIPDEWCAPSESTYYSVSWNYSDGDNDPRTRAEIEFIATDPSNNYLAEDTTSDSAPNQNYLLYDPLTGKLQSSTNYSARVRVFDGKEWSVWVNSGNSVTTPDYYPPLVNFDWSPKPVAAGTIVTFTDGSSDRSGGAHPLSIWEWMFRDGRPDSSSGRSETVIFNKLSPDNVSLKVTDDNDVSCILIQTVNGGGVPSKRRIFRER